MMINDQELVAAVAAKADYVRDHWAELSDADKFHDLGNVAYLSYRLREKMRATCTATNSL